MWHRAESAARASQAKHVSAFVLCAPSQLTARSCRCVLISQLNLCLLFFFSRRERRWIWCVLLLGMAISLPSPGVFFPPQDSKLSRVPPETYGSHHPAPLFPAQITHYRDLTKSSISNVLCHILSARLSRCCDCTIQTVGLLKAERETGTRLRAKERKRLWAHLQRNKTFRSHKQTSTCSISAFVLFVNN